LAIANRTQAKADDLAHTVRCAAPACAVEAGSTFDPAAFDIIINATFLGLNNQGPLPVEVARVSRTALVAEVVMVPELTPLLQAVQTRGLEIVCGREMLTQQGRGLRGLFWLDRLTQAKCKSESVVFAVPSEQQWGIPESAPGSMPNKPLQPNASSLRFASASGSG
jgi:shikimate 5-dehydrogenase